MTRVPFLAAAVVAALPLAGCATMQLQIPVSEAPKLETRTVRTIEGKTRSLAERYTLSPVANTGEVLLVDPADRGRLQAYPLEQAMQPPLLGLLDAPLLEGPVQGVNAGSDLVLITGATRFTVPAASVKWLRILQPDIGATAARAVGIGLGVAGAGLFAAWVLGAFR